MKMRKSRLQLEDLDDRSVPSATLANGVLTVDGTDRADALVVTQADGSISVRGMQIRVGDAFQTSVAEGAVTRIEVNGLGGNDYIDLRTVQLPATVDAGRGNDVVLGGSGGNTVRGGDGNDLFIGGAGNDSFDGGDGNDTVRAGAGNDTAQGGRGNDV